jgi:hypothetical protein
MHGTGVFFWRDGRTYKGEYKEDKKHKFGIYYGNEGKKYEGFWENGSQKNLGKYTKRDGSFKVGIWEENQLVAPIVDENEIAVKLMEIDNLVEDTNNRAAVVIYNLKVLFAQNLPDIDFESLLGFN